MDEYGVNHLSLYLRLACGVSCSDEKCNCKIPSSTVQKYLYLHSLLESIIPGLMNYFVNGLVDSDIRALASMSKWKKEEEENRTWVKDEKLRFEKIAKAGEDVKDDPTILVEYGQRHKSRGAGVPDWYEQNENIDAAAKREAKAAGVGDGKKSNKKSKKKKSSNNEEGTDCVDEMQSKKKPGKASTAADDMSLDDESDGEESDFDGLDWAKTKDEEADYVPSAAARRSTSKASSKAASAGARRKSSRAAASLYGDGSSDSDDMMAPIATRRRSRKAATRSKSNASLYGDGSSDSDE